MIGFFVKEGNTEVGKGFNPFLDSFRHILKASMANKNYSEGLKLILIQYHLEGKYLGPPAKPIKLERYRPKELSASTKVAVSRDFYRISDKGKREFIVNTTLESLELIRKQTQRLGLAVNFDELVHDAKICANEYLSQ